MSKKVIYDWNWVNSQIESIGNQLGELGEDIIYVTGIPRGGIIPAIMFSHKYDIPFIELQEVERLLPLRRTVKIILFDDISDTGRTFLKYTDSKYITAALAYRTTSKYLPTLVGQVVKDDHWLIFPWESTGAKAIQDYLVK